MRMSALTKVEFMARKDGAVRRWTHDFFAPTDEAIIDHFRSIVLLNNGTLLRIHWTKDREAAAIAFGITDQWVGSVRLCN